VIYPAIGALALEIEIVSTVQRVHIWKEIFVCIVGIIIFTKMANVNVIRGSFLRTESALLIAVKVTLKTLNIRDV